MALIFLKRAYSITSEYFIRHLQYLKELATVQLTG